MSPQDSNRYESAIVALTHAEKRLKVLPILLEEKSYTEILKETTAIAELSLKGILSHVGVQPQEGQPLLHTMEASIHRMPELIQKNWKRIAKVSGTIKQKNKRYGTGVKSKRPPSRKEASEAMGWGGFLVRMAQGVIKEIDD